MRAVVPVLVLLFALSMAACSLERNEPTRPGGTGIHVDVPGGAVSLQEGEVTRQEAGVAARCDNGSHADCNRVGHWLLEGEAGFPENAEAAATYLTSACDAGFAGACQTLGRMALEGRGLPRDAALAQSRYERACSLGLRAACTEMAVHGLEGALDIEGARAGTLLQEACHGGEVQACVRSEALAAVQAASAPAPRVPTPVVETGAVETDDAEAEAPEGSDVDAETVDGSDDE